MSQAELSWDPSAQLSWDLTGTWCDDFIQYVTVYSTTPRTGFLCRFLDDRYRLKSKRRATHLWKDLDDIVPKPPQLLFVPRWFRRTPAQHFIWGGCYTLTLILTLSYTCTVFNFGKYKNKKDQV